MTDTGPIDLPSFLQGSEPIAEPMVEEPKADMVEAALTAIAERRKPSEIRHEHTNTVEKIETLETIPPDLLESLQDLMRTLPEYQRRLDALENHAAAGQELHAALAGLQEINRIFQQVNGETNKRCDAFEATLAEMKTMIEPLSAFLLSLEGKRAA